MYAHTYIKFTLLILSAISCRVKMSLTLIVYSAKQNNLDTKSVDKLLHATKNLKANNFRIKLPARNLMCSQPCIFASLMLLTFILNIKRY